MRDMQIGLTFRFFIQAEYHSRGKDGTVGKVGGIRAER